MARKPIWLILLVAVALASPAVAGGDKYKCTEDTQNCLNKMAAKLKSRGWVGLELDHDDATGAMSVKRVVPDSPAEAAGFREGDTLVAFNGLRYGEAEKAAIEKEQAGMVPGKDVTFSVLRAGREHELAVTLGELPESVLAQWVGGHMLQHAVIAQVQN